MPPSSPPHCCCPAGRARHRGGPAPRTPRPRPPSLPSRPLAAGGGAAVPGTGAGLDRAGRLPAVAEAPVHRRRPPLHPGRPATRRRHGTSTTPCGRRGTGSRTSPSPSPVEVAQQFARLRPPHTHRQQPANKVRFAWWSAEELGPRGSEAYVKSLTATRRKQLALCLNFDMIASPDDAQLVHDGVRRQHRRHGRCRGDVRVGRTRRTHARYEGAADREPTGKRPQSWPQGHRREWFRSRFTPGSLPICHGMGPLRGRSAPPPWLRPVALPR
ncbi:M28 family peptidase [Streptomyces sp. SID10853]|nr:M28 family peptidase [Streptomyces sp. SID10853]